MSDDDRSRKKIQLVKNKKLKVAVDTDVIVSSYAIDPEEMLRLKQDYDADVEVQTCRERKKIETFRHKCTIAWWYMQDQVQLQTLPYFDQDDYMRKLQDVLVLAQDYLNLFHFAAFFIVKDMVGWVLRKDGTLPFGVVELGINKTDIPGTFRSVRRDGHFERQVIYECTDQCIADRYDFYVFEQGPVFRTSDRTYGGTTTNVVPVSAFNELFDDKRDIVEARVCLGDANFMASHPEGFIYSKPLPDTNIENIPEETRYIENDLAAASQATSLHRANLTSALAGQYVNRFRQQSASLTSRGFGTSIAQDKLMMQQMFYQHGGCGGGSRVGNEMMATLYHERQAEFMRPTVKESLEELPSYMEVSRGPAPAVLMHPGELQRRYDDKVCQLMNFPHIFFKPHTSGANPSGGKGGGSSVSSAGTSNNTNAGNLLFAQRQLDDAVVQQQSVYQQIFTELYKRTFALMDQLLFQRLPPEWAPITENITARMLFDNQITKSDDAIHGLLPFFKEGIVTDDDIRKLLERNFGLLTKEEQKKRLEGEANDNRTSKSNKTRKKAKKAKKKEKKTQSEEEEVDEDKEMKKKKAEEEEEEEEEKELKRKTKSSEKKEDMDEKKKKEKKRKADEIDH